MSLLKGICFTDTLELAESKQMSMFVEENTERNPARKSCADYGRDWQSSV